MHTFSHLCPSVSRQLSELCFASVIVDLFHLHRRDLKHVRDISEPMDLCAALLVLNPLADQMTLRGLVTFGFVLVDT